MVHFSFTKEHVLFITHTHSSKSFPTFFFMQRRCIQDLYIQTGHFFFCSTTATCYPKLFFFFIILLILISIDSMAINIFLFSLCIYLTILPRIFLCIILLIIRNLTRKRALIWKGIFFKTMLPAYFRYKCNDK